jgi:hypothetical protein
MNKLINCTEIQKMVDELKGQVAEMKQYSGIYDNPENRESISYLEGEIHAFTLVMGMGLQMVITK